jgi:Undecaprenyl-phosphate galactose phosphotransferase WbaP
LTSLKSHQDIASMALARAEPLYADRPRFAQLSCTVSLIAADFVAMLIAISLVGWIEAVVSEPGARLSMQAGSPVLREIGILYIVTALYLAMKGRYGARMPVWTEAHLVLSATLFAMAIEVTLRLLEGNILSLSLTLPVLLLFPTFAIIANRLTKVGLTRAGLWNIPIVVVGTGPSALATEAALISDKTLGYEIVGRVDPSLIMSGPSGPRMQQVLDRYRGSRLLLALDGAQEIQKQVIDCALRERVSFSIAPQASAFPAFAWETTRLFSQDAVLLSFRHGLSRRTSQITKGAIDLSAAAILLGLASPVFLVIAILCTLDGGPIFFSHRRIGAGGRSFACRKFRTMVVDSDRVLTEHLAANPAAAAEWAATRKLVHDPRITPVGRFLRKTSLDELPQLINVLTRDMSLVGPRPIVEGEVSFYGEDIAHYYGTRPGLTGLWQVSGRSNTTYARRVQLDVWYVNNWTVWLDIAVLLKTFPAVLSRNGAT